MNNLMNIISYLIYFFNVSYLVLQKPVLGLVGLLPKIESVNLLLLLLVSNKKKWESILTRYHNSSKVSFIEIEDELTPFLHKVVPKSR